jgi:hypothetical protein
VEWDIKFDLKQQFTRNESGYRNVALQRVKATGMLNQLGQGSSQLLHCGLFWLYGM